MSEQVINLGQIKPKFIDKSARQIEIEQVMRETRDKLLEKMRGSENLADWLRFHRGYILATPVKYSWQWDDEGGPTSEDLINYRDREGLVAASKRAETAVHALWGQINELEPKKDMVRVAIKRASADSTGVRSSVVLAVFPKTSEVNLPMRKKVADLIEEDDNIVVFFTPEQACIQHPADDLYKEHRESGAFYVPFEDMLTLRRKVDVDRSHTVHYLVEKREDEDVKQDPINTLMLGVLGGYGNEEFRFIVPQKFL